MPIDNIYTYSISESEYKYIKLGMRIAVPFGKNKVCTGLAYKLHNNEPSAYQTKDIYQILDEKPIVNQKQIEHWLWVSKYYMCSVGEVMRAALPSAFVIESDTMVQLIDTSQDTSTLTDNQYIVYEALEQSISLSIADISKILGKKNVFTTLNKMIDAKIIALKEEVYEKYKPKIVKYIRLHSKWNIRTDIGAVLGEVADRAVKQKEVVMSYFALNSVSKKPISVKGLSEKSNCSSVIISGLIKKEILETYEIVTDRVVFDGDTYGLSELSKDQSEAFVQIKKEFEQKNICLLHGVTGSGKTEIYCHLIQQCIDSGKQVLFILPEIGVTTHLLSKLQKYFGEYTSVYHSKYSINERVEVWNNVLNKQKKARIIIGTRLSVFLPFDNLGLVIVDEEHDSSHKQIEPSPRFHARDAAIVLASMHGAKTLLGSATPALETYYNASKGKYSLVSLNKRYKGIQLPEVELIDIKQKFRKKEMTNFFSDTLISEIEKTVEKREQVIIFQNKRGYAPKIECQTCNNIPYCPSCDVSLTLHKFRKELRCHYCRYRQSVPHKCSACGSAELDSKGVGTEQIEVELKKILPNINIGRMDLDTTKGKYGYQKIFESFIKREIDVLIGTQMVSKGLDFENVSLVGIINADDMLHFQDFRAHERTFDTLVQVAGRSGRFGKRGKVLLQSYNPYHQILQQVTVNDYKTMYEQQLYERKQFAYPPFFRMIKITLKHRNYNVLESAANWLNTSLRNTFNDNVLGPSMPAVSKVRNLHIKYLILKLPNDKALITSKKYILKIKDSFMSISAFRSVKMVIDVDFY